jgi:hypothetical protein
VALPGGTSDNPSSNKTRPYFADRVSESDQVNRKKAATAPPPPGGFAPELVRRSLRELVSVRVLWEEDAPRYDARVTRIAWGMAGLFAVAYAVMFAWLSPLALQDFPNHLARVRVIVDLLFQHGAHFGDQFELHFLAIPYLLGDLALAAATRLFGVANAAVFWSILTFLSLPAALLVYLSTTRLRPDAQAMLVLVSLYIATDWFFLMGFLEYRVGVALTLLVLALAERFRMQSTLGRLSLFTVVLFAGYLTHLTTLVFAATLLTTMGVWRLLTRQTRLPVEAALLVPCAALLLWHFGFTGVYRQPGDLVENPYVWGTLELKLAGLSGEFQRYHPRSDQLMLLALGAAVVCQVGYFWRARVRLPAVSTEFLVLAGSMLAAYFILPMGYAEAYYVDVRALPYMVLFLLLGVLSLVPADSAGPTGKPVLALLFAVALVGGNFVYLAKHMQSQKQWLAEYRSVIAVVPTRSRVLPIYTHAREGSVVPFLHSFAFASIDRDAVIPYLQTGDTGNPQKYLRYRRRPYAPDEMWYSNLPPSRVDWETVACEYQYLLVTKPFDPARLAVSTRVTKENSSASLLAIQKPALCAPANSVSGRSLASTVSGDSTGG